MRKIESKRPNVLGRISRNHPRNDVANFTPQIDIAIIHRAEAQAVRDGFPYFRDLILVLMALYGNGSLSKKLGRDMRQMIKAWVSREDPESGRRVVKRNMKLRRDVYENAVSRWKNESDDLSATAMFAFLLESYADGEIEIALRRGKKDE